MTANENDGNAQRRTPERSSGLKLFVPSTPRTRNEVEGISEGLTPDDVRLDTILTGVALDLMLTAKDENVKASVLHDMLTTRGFFAKAAARGALAASAGLAALTLKPDVFVSLLGGLADLGVVTQDAASAVARNVTEEGTNETHDARQP